MNNMYNEIWRRVVSVESLLKDIGRQGNMTRQDILDEVRSLTAPERDFPGDSQDNYLEIALDTLERKLQKLSRNLDDRLDTLTARQDLVMDSCFEGVMCREIEAKLSQVLERIFDVLSDKLENSTNRTLSLDKLVMEMMDLVKVQHSNLIRTVAHNTNKVVTLADDNNYAIKLFQHNITQLANDIQELHDEFANVFGRTLCDGNTTTNDLQKPLKLQFINNTRVKFIPLNKTEQTKDLPKDHYDVGVVKITTDNLGVLADNSSLSSESRPLVIDDSIMQIITTIYPNLTRVQIESMLRVLNSSVSFDSLEAIIQNTQAEPNVEIGSTEMFENEHMNQTKFERSVFNFGEVITMDTILSTKNENNSEVIENITGQDTATESTANSTNVPNVTVYNETSEATVTVANKTEPPSVQLSSDLKEKLKVYTFLWKIKHGFINMTLFKQKLESDKENITEHKQILFIKQKLCDDINKEGKNVMSNSLEIVNKTLIKTDLYNVIKEICNIILDNIQSHNINISEVV